MQIAAATPAPTFVNRVLAASAQLSDGLANSASLPKQVDAARVLLRSAVHMTAPANARSEASLALANLTDASHDFSAAPGSTAGPKFESAVEHVRAAKMLLSLAYINAVPLA